MSERSEPRRHVRETTSFRFPQTLVQRLDQRAGNLGVTRTTLAEQFLEEGLRLVEHPGIAFRAGASRERRAAISGTRLDVWMVVEIIRANGGIERAADYLEVPAHRIEAAARYYAAYPGEIDEEIRQNQAYADREMQLDAERRRLLG
jgi:uncharacterized protein (DUF433 family)/predicted DNA-binding protein